MTGKSPLLMIFLTLLIFSLNCFASITIEDDLGFSLSFDKPPSRVVTLSPHLSELMFYLGYQEHLVARDSASDFPEFVKNLPSIGNSQLLNMESILEQKPDLILAWYSGINPAQAKQFSDLGIQLFYSEPSSLQAILNNMHKLEVIFGATEKSQQAIKLFESSIDTPKTLSGKRTKVFYQVWDKPLTTLNGQHFVTEIIALCGGENIFDELDILAPQVNIEAVLQRKPDVIVSGQSKENQKLLWGNWQSIPAVKNETFVYINPDLLVRPGPRIIQGKQALCEAISNR